MEADAATRAADAVDGDGDTSVSSQFQKVRKAFTDSIAQLPKRQRARSTGSTCKSPAPLCWLPWSKCWSRHDLQVA